MKFSFISSEIIKEPHVFKKGEGLQHELMGICDFSIMIDCHYLCIDISSFNNRVYGISGYVSVEKLPKATIKLPSSIKDGSLYISDCDVIPGTVKNYTFPLHGKFDKNSRCICLGNDKCNTVAIRIAENVLISVDDNRIVAIFIMNI